MGLLQANSQMKRYKILYIQRIVIHYHMSKKTNYSDLAKKPREELLKRREQLLNELKSGTNEPSATVSLEGRTTSDKIVEEVNAIEKVIYVVDDRKEVDDVNDSNVQDNVSSVVGLIEKEAILDNGNGTSTIRTRVFGVAKNLCQDEKFYNQPQAPFCTGFLVDKDIITTAAHCIQSNDELETMRFVFGFKMKNGEAQTVIDNGEIYRGIEIIDRVFDRSGPDWALIKLDREVNNNHKIAKIRRSGKINDGEAVYIIGHPARLPMKFADGANVRNNSNSAYFVANCDSYGGNSGSPVFNSNTNEVEGILVRGETDFILLPDRQCVKSKVCPDNGCDGESCTRTTEFIQRLL